MPQFELLPVGEAMLKSATGKRAEIQREYLGYIEQLQGGQAGSLRATDGETVGAIRRRLGAAAKLSGKALTIKPVGDGVFFWVQTPEEAPRRRRGRPRKDARPG